MRVFLFILFMLVLGSSAVMGIMDARKAECAENLILRNVTVDGYDHQDVLIEDGVITAVGGELSLDNRCSVTYNTSGIRIVMED